MGRAYFAFRSASLGLLLTETVSLPVHDGAARNPAEPAGREDRPVEGHIETRGEETVKQVLNPLIPPSLKAEPSQVIVSRVLAVLAHLGLRHGHAADRMAPFRAADLGHGDGRLLFVITVHPHGRGRQRPVDLGRADSAGRLLVRATVDRGLADRTGGRLDSRLPWPHRPLGRVLQGPRNAQVSGGRLLGRAGLCAPGSVDH